jgi:hypothetical protein
MFVRVNSCRGFKVDASHIQGLLQYDLICRLGSVMISMLAIGPTVPGFKSGLDDGFLSAIKAVSVRSTPSFGEVKPLAICLKILRQSLRSMNKDT